ncbi:MAG: hypothetical protein HN742_22140 [Lentisphaerae bacterium]|jgi:hypothetical protein|nr:hypothetical protein [Lentisphaerota bacterium]MBT4816144.1 hypothetical protein [Lentisphaerota bacterium]MBT5605259.1 hypothetical protein [Lentisphaerota bacterium]MBT7059238.1 hypothetical protein [Lentisphaerota bacterium]MBT7844593.1 hypothetical protein [Lentisphaerota bacterium]
MHQPKWCLFYDFHTMPACPDVGAAFDADAFTDRIKACGVDFVVFPARCNSGTAYYDTNVGMRHPSLTYDMFGRLVEACQARDIAISAYINVGLSHEEGLLRRDWTIITPEGYVYQPNRESSFFRRMCLNSPYGNHVLEMIEEVVSNYPVSGLFLDSFHQMPCVGVECVREMKEHGLDWRNEKQLEEFALMSKLRLARRIKDSVHDINPELNLFYNGLTFEQQQDLGTYLELECLPTGGWGYEILPAYARYMRNLGGKTCVNMTGRFHRTWGDFGGIRSEASLEYDCLYGLANGMRVTVGDHFHPRGDLNHAVHDLVERIYGRLRRLEPWVDGATACTDVGLVIPKPGFHRVDPKLGRNAIAISKGATRMLCELNVQFDVLTHACSWEGYDVLILPDYVTADADTCQRLRNHLDKGGRVIASAWSGLDPEGAGFPLSEWCADFAGDDPLDPAYFQPDPAISNGLPAMPMDFYGKGVQLSPRENAETLAEVIAPYYNREFDGEHYSRYAPPDRPAGRPAVVRNAQVTHISHTVFSSYHEVAWWALRNLVGNLLNDALPTPLIKAPDLPSFARVTVMEQPGRRIVHILAYVPEHRGAATDMIEEPARVGDIDLALLRDGKTSSRVYLAPGKQELTWENDGDYIHTTVPDVIGHAHVVFEE